MKYFIFSSGSKGNATLISSNGVNILIDLGISKTALSNHLERINHKLEDINLILLTHDHGDHTSGLHSMKNFDIYGGDKTFKSPKYHVLTPYKSFKYKDIDILPLEVSHDATNPLGFIISNDKDRLVYITDTGYMNEKNMKLASNATYYIFESNHDVEMLLKTHRPEDLKQRILSEFGHMSNIDSATYLCEMIGDKTKEIALAHISMEANTYPLAESTCISTLKKHNINISKLKIKTAKQFESIEGGYED